MRHNCMGRPTQSTVKELEKPHAKSQRWKLEAVVIASNCTIASPYVRITQGRYIEVYIPISLEVCVLRSETGMHSLDPKWLPSKLIIFKNTYVCRNTILRHIMPYFLQVSIAVLGIISFPYDCFPIILNCVCYRLRMLPELKQEINITQTTCINHNKNDKECKIHINCNLMLLSCAQL